MRYVLIVASIASVFAASACGDDGSSGNGGAGGSPGAGGDGGASTASTTSTTVTASGTATASGTGSASTTVTSTATASTGDTVASSSASTGAGPLECSGADPSFAAMVQPILTESCAVTSCHRGANPDKDLDLSEGAAWAELVGVTTEECNGDRVRVTPGQPEASYLVSKIRDEDLCGTSRRMPPPNRDMLPAAQIQTIVDWICSGAEDD